MVDEIIYGRNPVLEILSSSRDINKILIVKNLKGKAIDDIVKKAKEKKIVFSFVDKQILDSKARNHQGVIAYLSSKAYVKLEDLIDTLDIKKNPILCILDSVKDPHNLGAVARSAYTLGVSGLLIPKRNACSVNSTVVKTSAGAIEFVPVCQIENINNTIGYLKDKGFWIVGSDMKGSECWNYDFNRPTVVILGSEENGIHQLVKKNCDDIIRIPQVGYFNSLNVSCAASVLFYEIQRQKNSS